jgi:hypothetical protein
MKKFAFICAAVFALAAPTVASAQGIGVHIGDDGYRDRGAYRGDYREHRGPRVEYREHDRGLAPWLGTPSLGTPWGPRNYHQASPSSLGRLKENGPLTGAIFG